MLALILTVCALADPADCHVERRLYAEVTPMQCALQGQQRAAEWVAENPGYRVARWRCAPASRESDPA